MRQREIFKFWLPLFASWLLMSAEGPTISAAINRLPNEIVMLAAQGIVISLAVTIESPIINLLSTSTALVRDRASYLLVRKFTIHWAVVLTAISFLIAFTPVFDLVVVSWLDAPAEVARWVRPGLQIMPLWSAAIAWRRFLQGVLIRFNHTKQVAWGTGVRLISSGGTVIGLAMWSSFPGVVSGALALMAGVISEALVATIAVRPLLKNELSVDRPPSRGKVLTYRALFWFHLPLAGTSVMTLLAQPLVNFSLARLSHPTESLAAWPVLFQMMLMARAAAFALPEVVIALSDEPENFQPIRRFTAYLTAAVTASSLLFIFSPAARFYIYNVQDMAPQVGVLAQQALALFLLFPAMAAVTSWLRGLLINRENTKEVNIGMGINMGLTAAALAYGLLHQLPGLPTAAVALNLGALVEMVYLGWRAQQSLGDGVHLIEFRKPAALPF